MESKHNASSVRRRNHWRTTAGTVTDAQGQRLLTGLTLYKNSPAVRSRVTAYRSFLSSLSFPAGTLVQVHISSTSQDLPLVILKAS
ncbi:hypothetical protein ACOMHN_009278 [Nucella lapillus]